jgi:hypothetical protein
MNVIFSIVRFVTYSVGAIAIRKTWNWLTEDVDPVPGTKEFAKEYRETYGKYQRLRRKHESYNKSRKRTVQSNDTTN